MAKFILIASAESIAVNGRKLQESLSHPEDILIVEAYMEEALAYVRHQLPEDAEVVIARGNTAKMLKAAKVFVPIVTIPFSDLELIQSVEKAKSIYGGDESSIAYIGIEDTVNAVRGFLERIHCHIRLYPVQNSQNIQESVRRAKKEHVDVVIGGIYTGQIARQYGLGFVMLESSQDSIKEAYERALEVQKGALLQKKKINERNTLLQSISDGIVTINNRGKITLYNSSAEACFQIPAKQVLGKSSSLLFSDVEQGIINQVLLSGKRMINHIMQIRDGEYVLDFHPVMVHQQIKSVIITMRRCRSLAGQSLPHDFPSYRTKSESGLQKPESTSAQNDIPGMDIWNLVREGRVCFHQLIGEHAAFRSALTSAMDLARSSFPILLIGQSGTGKQTFSQCIHQESSRREEVYLAKDAAFLQESDFLFVHRGTLYLEEISAISMQMASALCEILETGVLSLADGRRVHLDIRIIAGTSRRLEGSLSPRLYHRLIPFRISLPSLTQRASDIPLLVEEFLREFDAIYSKHLVFSPEANTLLERSVWSGNIRQLKGACQRISYYALEGEVVTADRISYLLNEENSYACLSEETAGAEQTAFLTTPSSVTATPPFSGKCFLIHGRSVSYEEIKSLERYYQGNRGLMAQKLGISRSTLWRYLKIMRENVQ